MLCFPGSVFVLATFKTFCPKIFVTETFTFPTEATSKVNETVSLAGFGTKLSAKVFFSTLLMPTSVKPLLKP